MAPKKVIGSGLPLPDVYAGRQAHAEQAYQAALADLAKQQRSQFTQYGFQGDVNEETGAVNARIDPKLSFGLIQQMLRSHSANRTALRENTSGRGLGRTGLARQRQNLLKFLQQGDIAGIGNRFNTSIQGIFGQRGNARRNRDQEFNAAEQEAVNYAIANGLFNEAPGPAPHVDTPVTDTSYAPPAGSPTPAGANTGQYQQPGGANQQDLFFTGGPESVYTPPAFDPVAYQQELAAAMAKAAAPTNAPYTTTPYNQPTVAQHAPTGSGNWGELVAYDPLDPGAGIKYNRRR